MTFFFTYNLFSPLEQFIVIPYTLFGFSFTNQTTVLFLLYVFLIFLVDSLVCKDFTFYVKPLAWQRFLENINSLVLSLTMDNIKDKKASRFTPLLYCIFLFVLFLNLVGLIPFSFTLTSHIIVTFAFALILFIGINIIGVKKFGIQYFSLFLPPGTSIVLSLLLVPIELISYIFKPVSLSIRLFANMMAGHTLLKVIAGFGFTLMNLGGGLFFLHYLPLLLLIPLLGLELAVALIQTFVFSILICIYLNDALNLH
jgi:ATP synthase subunit 6